MKLSVLSSNRGYQASPGAHVTAVLVTSDPEELAPLEQRGGNHPDSGSPDHS
jgi:hypothetical protein